MITSHKELRKILKEAEASGWQFKLGGRHIKGSHESGRRVTVSVTPQDGRALKNIRKDLFL
jgi:predicted RNA binding protein YcfA (HicA-like mRNA interferase family)